MPFADTTKYQFNGDWNQVSGVYGIMNSSSQMIYIGETDDLRRRMAEHRADTTHRMHRYAPTLVWVEVIVDARQRSQREQVLIAEYDPPANR